MRRKEARQLVAARSSLELKRLQRLQKLRDVWKQWRILNSNDCNRILDIINALDLPKDFADFLELKRTPSVTLELESKLDVNGNHESTCNAAYFLILIAESAVERPTESEIIDPEDQVSCMRRRLSYASNLL